MAKELIGSKKTIKIMAKQINENLNQTLILISKIESKFKLLYLHLSINFLSSDLFKIKILNK